MGYMEQRMDEEIERGHKLQEHVFETIFDFFDKEIGFQAKDCNLLADLLSSNKVPYVVIKLNNPETLTLED